MRAASNSNTTVFGICNVTVTPSGRIEVTSVTVDPKAVTIAKDDARTLSVGIMPANATDPSVTWSSSNTTVATVNTSGVVTARSDGKATITAKSNSNENISDSCEVTVTSDKIEVTDVTVTPATAIVAMGAYQSLRANITPDYATDRSVTWISSNSAVASVSSTGVVFGESEGTATITARSNSNANVTGSCEVTVIPGSMTVTGLTVSPKMIMISKIGDGIRIMAEVTPQYAANSSVTWSSSNTAVASVNQGGWVTALSSGTTTITARSNSNTSVSDTCNVAVSVDKDSGCNSGWSMIIALFAIAPLVLLRNKGVKHG
jgi:uncharacterized protein YjdB